MSYNPQAERDDEVSTALQTRDAAALLRLARLYKKEDEDEYAETLQMAAKKIEEEDWAYDEAKDNSLTD